MLEIMISGNRSFLLYQRLFASSFVVLLPENQQPVAESFGFSGLCLVLMDNPTDTMNSYVIITGSFEIIVVL